jgi:hypothetical protein
MQKLFAAYMVILSNIHPSRHFLGDFQYANSFNPYRNLVVGIIISILYENFVPCLNSHG